jgi:DNA repair protein RecN (Recombination protein N)
MLRRLSLRDFVIVQQLDVDLSAGFTALTGETGAGKSILIDALQLTLGSRGDAGVVREGAARADLCAEFELNAALAAKLQPWLHEAGFEPPNDGHTLLLRRVVDAQGKSRAWVNGGAATLTQLRELGEHLVDIHGQHAWQSLTRPEAVRALVDEQAGVDTAAMQAAWQSRREAQRLLDDARRRQGELERERERLQWQVGELAKLNPQTAEWDTLNAEHQALSHGQAILDAARVALDAVSEGEENADTATGRALDALNEVANVSPELANVAQALRDVQAQLQDAAHSLKGTLNHTDLEPERLAELDARMSAWVSLARRYRRTPAELPELLEGWRSELAALEAASDLDGLKAAVDAAHGAWLKQAQAASKLRQQVAPQWAEAITTAMQDLGLAGGRFEVALTPLAEPHAQGLESIEFLVAGHAGSTPRPLAKVASGGELSRLALAIAVTAAQEDADGCHVPTLIFDEIDAGIGGAVGDTVGRLMRRLGGRRQVLAVTHLAQVAACAHAQLLVAKALQQGQTCSEIRRVDGDERVREVARMLGGSITDSSRAHAQGMVDDAVQSDQADLIEDLKPTASGRPRRKKEAA